MSDQSSLLFVFTYLFIFYSCFLMTFSLLRNKIELTLVRGEGENTTTVPLIHSLSMCFHLSITLEPEKAVHLLNL